MSKYGQERLMEMEKRAGGPTITSAMLGVAYRGTYAPWKRGEKDVPPYIVKSINAHLALSKRDFETLKKIAERQAHSSK